MRKAKSIGWAIYAAGFAIWLFGYLSLGHAESRRSNRAICVIFITLQNFFGTALEKG
jgi:hypothetical protein